MNTNLNSQIPAVRSLSSEGWATVAGVVGSALLLAKKVSASRGAKAEPMSRADFYAELLDLKDHMHTNHLAMLERLNANQRELLAALERLAARVNVLEAGLARVDERTRK
jgi:hypothetical protein